MMLRNAFLVGVMLLAGCAGTSSSNDDDDVGCTKDTDCRAGRICEDDECVWPEGSGGSSGGFVDTSSSRGGVVIGGSSSRPSTGSSMGTGISIPAGSGVPPATDTGGVLISVTPFGPGGTQGCRPISVSGTSTPGFVAETAVACDGGSDIFLRLRSEQSAVRCYIYATAYYRNGTNILGETSTFLRGAAFSDGSSSFADDHCLAPGMRGWINFYGVTDPASVTDLQITELTHSASTNTLVTDYDVALSSFEAPSSSSWDLVFTVRNTGSGLLKLNSSNAMLLDGMGQPMERTSLSVGTDSFLEAGSTGTLTMHVYDDRLTANVAQVLVYPDIVPQ